MKRIALAIFLISTPALAQQQGPTPNQIIGSEIIDLMMQRNVLQQQITRLQSMLQTSQERIKALEDKYEPKAPTEGTK